jgi:hypothetical protein
MSSQVNCCSFGPQSDQERKLLNWRRLDCLAASKLKHLNKQQVLDWFKQQDDEWMQARRSRLLNRLGV